MKVLILFDGAHLAYSPSVTQLYDELSKQAEVTVVAMDPHKVTNQKLSNRRVIYYDYVTGKAARRYRVLFKALSFFNRTVKLLRENNLGYNVYFFEFLLFKRLLKTTTWDRVIAVDNRNLFLCTLLGRHADFLSLELCANEHLVAKVNTGLVDSVLIQSVERKNYLFGDKNLRVFYVQNAPVFSHITPKEKRRGLIFSGTAWDAFGFYYCLDYIDKYPGETLTVQGVILPDDKKIINDRYVHLLEAERLVLNTTYFENNEVEEYISNYEIGFAFYNFSIPWVNNYNYKTAPSGKLFKYLAAGVPVIGIDIIGFDFIKEFECGVLIKELNADEIRKAVLTIRDNYGFYVENALRAARHFSFDKAVAPYLEYIKE